MFENGFKRFYDSLEGIPDRVPFIAQMHEFAMKLSEGSAKIFYSDPDFIVRSTIDAAIDFGFDIPWLGYDVYNIEAEALGIPLNYSDNLPPEVASSKPLIHSRNDLVKLKIPDPYSSGRMPFVLEANKLYEKSTGYPPPIQFTAPFSVAITLRGFENFILDIYQQPDFAHDVLKFITEKILAPWIQAMQKESPKATLYRGADAMASMPLVNIHILREFVVPYIIKLKQLCGQEITVLNWWGESHLENPEKMLALKLKISPTIVQGQDPDVEKIGPELYKKFAVKHDSALILGIGNLFLQKAAKAEIGKRIRHYIKAGASGGRFMIYFCYLSSETPGENVKAAIKAVKDSGVYENQTTN
jgi:uroporphyrinogen-III decarboxylase